MDKVIFIFFVVYFFAVRSAFPQELSNLRCNDKAPQCAKNLQIVFHQLFNMERGEFIRDQDAHLVMKFPLTKTYEHKKRHQISAGDFFQIKGIKKISGLVFDYFKNDKKVEQRPLVSECYVSWYTKLKFASGVRNNLPKNLLDEPLHIRRLEVENVFNKFGSFDYSLVKMSFKFPMDVGFYDNADLTCEISKEKIDIAKIQEYMGNEISILGVFQEKTPASQN